MEILLLLVWVISLIYETYIVSYIRSKLLSGLFPLQIGGGLVYFIFNLLTIGIYGIYWCVKADEHLQKMYEASGKQYQKTSAWQWYFWGSFILVGPFIAFSNLKNRVDNVNNSGSMMNSNLSSETNYSMQTTAQEAQENDTKECPYCAETIKKKATMCRFCGHELENWKDILTENNLVDYIDVFEKNKLTDLEVISELTELDLEKLGVTIMGDRKRVLKIFNKAHASLSGADERQYSKNDVSLETKEEEKVLIAGEKEGKKASVAGDDGVFTKIKSTFWIRADPSLAVAGVTWVTKGDNVEKLETKNEWDKIKTSENIEGWIPSEYLEEEEKMFRIE